MMTIDQKIQKHLANFQLLPSEIKKAERMSNKNLGRTDCRVTGYGYKVSAETTEIGFLDVKCEICVNDMSERVDDITLVVCLFDRHATWATPDLTKA